MEIPGWVFEAIKGYSGLDASLLSAGALIRAVRQRMAALDLYAPAAYWPLLREGSPELNSLVQRVTNKETYFFREPRQFQALRDRVLPELVAARQASGAKPELRLWSAGCATGEEAYSLAMTLADYRYTTGARFDATVIGTDIDVAALERARQACYDERAVRLVPDDLRARYLTGHGDRWCVAPDVAQLVSFQAHNLGESCFPQDLVELDVIFCRNVTIYFTEEMRDRLNSCMARMLRDGGYLFVASAETLGHDRGRLALVSLANGSVSDVHGFAFQKVPTITTHPTPRAQAPEPDTPQLEPSYGSAPVRRAVPAHAAAPSRRARRDERVPSVQPAPGADPPADPPALQAARRAFREQAYGAALHHLDLLSAEDTARQERRCLRAAILLQQEKPDEANDLCRRVLDEDPWHPDAYLLLALGYRQQGRAAEAVGALKQAIYLRPQDPQAHFFLADTYRLLDLSAGAVREYENTLNILDRKPAAAAGVPVDPMHTNLAGVHDDLMLRACRAHLFHASRRKGQRA